MSGQIYSPHGMCLANASYSTGFDCSNFQYQLKRQNKPFKDHVFQVSLVDV